MYLQTRLFLILTPVFLVLLHFMVFPLTEKEKVYSLYSLHSVNSHQELEAPGRTIQIYLVLY
jgi:hypothetical protein